MVNYVIKNCKRYWWVLLLVVFLSALTTIASQYIYKFIGFAIDYGLNFTGETYTGAFSFLFDGNFGGYGTIKLVTTLSICVVIFTLLSHLSSYTMSYVQMRGQNAIMNRYRFEIYNKGRRKKVPLSNGDMLVLLNEDLLNFSYIFINYLPGIIGSVLSIGYTLFMLSSISPYLLITPVALTPLLVYYSIKYNKATYSENQIYRNVDGELKEVITRITATEQMEEYKTFKPVNTRHTIERQKLGSIGNKYSTILNVIKIMIYIISCTVAGILAIRGDILIGEYLIFTAFINTIYAQIITLIGYFVSIKGCVPRVEKVKVLMEEHLNEKETECV